MSLAHPRIMFAGTPDFAATILSALLAEGAQVVAVLTAPDRRSGRGMHYAPTPVKIVAEAAHIPVLSLPTIKTPEAQAVIAGYAPDLLIVAAYGYIVPAAVLSLPPLGCINVHASLLPRWRGAAPVHRALLAGDQQTGVVIMKMEAGLDTGPVALTYPLSLKGEETGVGLMQSLAQLGAAAMKDLLFHVSAGSLVWVPQSEQGVTYAHKIEKSEMRIVWSSSAMAIERQVRTFSGAPGAHAEYAQVCIKIHQAQLSSLALCGDPGRVLLVDQQGIHIATGDGILCVQALQKTGGRRLTAAQFVQGFPIAVSSLWT